MCQHHRRSANTFEADSRSNMWSRKLSTPHVTRLRPHRFARRCRRAFAWSLLTTRDPTRPLVGEFLAVARVTTRNSARVRLWAHSERVVLHELPARCLELRGRSAVGATVVAVHHEAAGLRELVVQRAAGLRVFRRTTGEVAYERCHEHADSGIASDARLSECARDLRNSK